VYIPTFIFTFCQF